MLYVKWGGGDFADYIHLLSLWVMRIMMQLTLYAIMKRRLRAIILYGEHVLYHFMVRGCFFVQAMGP